MYTYDYAEGANLHSRISNPTMEEIGTTNPKYIPAIASFMAPIHALITLEKPYASPWDKFTHLLNKPSSDHCIKNHRLEAC